MNSRTSKRGESLEQRRLRVFRAWSTGTSQIELAEREKVHPGQICRDIAAVLHTLPGPDSNDAEKAKLTLLGKLLHVESELLAAWERSKKPRTRRKAKTVKPRGQSKATGLEEAEAVEEDRDGNGRFLELLQANWEKQAKLLGLIVHKIAPTDPTGEQEWQPMSEGERDAIRKEIDSRLGGEAGTPAPEKPDDGGGPPVAEADDAFPPGWDKP